MWTVMDSPVGELRIVATNGAVTGIDFLAGFGEADRRQSSTAYAIARGGRPTGDRADSDPLLKEAVQQLTSYFRRDLKEFDLPLAPVGTPFQLRVWERLRTIPYGSTATYGEVAAALGMTGHGARAVGLANGRNPIPVVVPCHRVVGAGGSLTGYGGGIERKQVLLDLETEALF